MYMWAYIYICRTQIEPKLNQQIQFYIIPLFWARLGCPSGTKYWPNKVKTEAIH